MKWKASNLQVTLTDVDRHTCSIKKSCTAVWSEERSKMSVLLTKHSRVKQSERNSQSIKLLQRSS